MSFLNSFDISGYGLTAQRQRINTISSNIANANTTRTDEGGPYKRKSIVFKAVDFNEVLNQKIDENSKMIKFSDPLREGAFNDKPKPALSGVVVDKIVRDDGEPIMRYEPGHPDANNEGYVAYPNINPVVEMADMVEATRAYQANVAAFQSAKTMATTAIDMMRT
ncbi:MAG: flagellar basal body rod protein FlgC [Campylobacterota bacterium]